MKIDNTMTPVQYVRSLSDRQIADFGKELFPKNKYQRMQYHAWCNTIRNNCDPFKNPGSYPLNICGDPGYGKSGLVYSMKHTMSEWLSAGVGSDVEWEVITRTLAGVIDIADIVGIPNVNKEDKWTELYPPKSFPASDDPYRVGIIFADDVNRGHEGPLSGYMEFVNTRRINDYKLPDGFGVTAATNPANGKNRVRPLDEAQETRFIPIVYTPGRELFMEQLAIQGVPAVVYAFFQMYPEIAPAPVEDPNMPILKEPRPVNWRNSTMFAHMMATIQYDSELQIMLARSIFGPKAITDIAAVVKGEIPLSPHQILGATEEQRAKDPELTPIAEAKAVFTQKLTAMNQKNATELISASTIRLASEIEKMKKFDLTPEQFDNLCEYLLLLPASSFGDFIRRCVSASSRHKDVFTAPGDSPFSMLSWKKNEAGIGALYNKIIERRANRARIDEEVAKHSESNAQPVAG